MDVASVCRAITYKVILSDWTVLLAIKLLGGAFLIRILFSLIKTTTEHRSFQKSRTAHSLILSKLLAKHNIAPSSVITVQHNEFIAATIGILKPKIVISSALSDHLEPNELEAVLLHERHHQQHHDGLILLIGKLSSSVFFFIPLVHDLMLSIKLWMEHRADQYSINKQQTSQYLSAALAKSLGSSFQLHPAFAAEFLHERIALINNPSSYHFKLPFTRTTLSLAMIILTTWLIQARKLQMVTATDRQTLADCTVSQIFTPAQPFSVKKNYSPQFSSSVIQ